MLIFYSIVSSFRSRFSASVHFFSLVVESKYLLPWRQQQPSNDHGRLSRLLQRKVARRRLNNWDRKMYGHVLWFALLKNMSRKIFILLANWKQPILQTVSQMYSCCLSNWAIYGFLERLFSKYLWTIVLELHDVCMISTEHRCRMFCQAIQCSPIRVLKWEIGISALYNDVIKFFPRLTFPASTFYWL